MHIQPYKNIAPQIPESLFNFFFQSIFCLLRWINSIDLSPSLLMVSFFAPFHYWDYAARVFFLLYFSVSTISTQCLFITFIPWWRFSIFSWYMDLFMLMERLLLILWGGMSLPGMVSAVRLGDRKQQAWVTFFLGWGREIPCHCVVF